MVVAGGGGDSGCVVGSRERGKGGSADGGFVVEHVLF